MVIGFSLRPLMNKRDAVAQVFPGGLEMSEALSEPWCDLFLLPLSDLTITVSFPLPTMHGKRTRRSKPTRRQRINQRRRLNLTKPKTA
jgi:hypothetical protein